MILNSLAFAYVHALNSDEPLRNAAIIFKQNDQNPSFVKFAMGVFQIKLNFPRVWQRILSQILSGE